MYSFLCRGSVSFLIDDADHRKGAVSFIAVQNADKTCSRREQNVVVNLSNGDIIFRRLLHHLLPITFTSVRIVKTLERFELDGNFLYTSNRKSISGSR
jgi:hypothetical protein